MDPQTNNPIDSTAPQPLGPPLHPPQEPAPSSDSTFQPQTPEPSAPSPQVFTPTNSPPPPAPAQSLPQNPVSSPMPPMPPQSPAVGVVPPSSPVSAGPAPVVVSGGFTPGVPGAPVVGTVGQPFQPPSGTPPPPPPAPASGRRKLKPLLIGLAAIVILAGGSAAAYFGVIAPNQPENVLKAAIVNSLKENSVSYNGTVNLDYQASGGGSSQSYQVSLSGSRNATAKASDVTLGFEGYGVKLSLEARIVNQNLYLKAGDLSTLAALAGTFEPSLASTATTISNDISNQWVEVDSSLLSEAGVSCFINAANQPFSNADINELSSDYTKNSFLVIQKTSNTTVDGQAAEEFTVNLNDNKGAGFLAGLSNLSSVKSMETCKGGNDLGTVLSKAKGDGKQTPLTLWVSKSSKQIIQISATDTAQEAAQSHAKGTVTVKLNYSPVSIPTPANAESVIQLYTKLQPTLSGLDSSGLNLSNLLSGGSSAATSFLKP